jgi:hypothetical protein
VPEATGSYNTIYIFADQPVRERVENVLASVYDKTIRTPQEEKVFTLSWANLDSLGRLSTAKNLIFLAELSGGGKTSLWVVSSLDTVARRRVAQGRDWIFVKHDVYARGQIAIYLIAPTSTELASNILINAKMLYNLVDSSINERVKKYLYSPGFGERERVDIEKKLAKQWGFTLRVPGFYSLEKFDTNFVWIRALKPERWVFVYFETTDDKSLNTKYWLEKRNYVGAQYYEGDIILDSTLTLEESTIDNERALKFSGLWFNPESYLGGPFVSYLFYKTEQKRKYIVDCALFAPIVRKEPYLRHLNIIAQTFTTKTEHH